TMNDLAGSALWVQSTAGALGIVGLLSGAIAGPKMAQALVNAGNAIENMSSRDKIAVGIGTFLGVIANLPIFLILLRWPVFGAPFAILLGVAFVYLGIRAALSMKDEFRFVGGAVPVGPDGAEISMDHCKILDTNVIIDGRIKDVCQTGFLQGPLYVP